MEKLISKKIKLFNVIFTILIVVFHNTGRYYEFLINTGFNDKAFKIIDFFNRSLYIAMIYFFFISGFLFYNNVSSAKDCLTKLKKRFKTLIIPFLLWNLLVFIYSVARHYLIPAGSIFYCDVDLLSWRAIYNSFFADPLCGPLWYLVALFIMMLPSFIVGFIKDKKPLVISLFLIIYFYLKFRTRSLISVEDIWWWGNIPSHFPIFLLGGYIGLYYPDLILKKDYSNKWNNVLGIVMLIVGFFAMIKNDNRTFGLLLVAGLWLLINPKWLNKSEVKLSNITFYVYALHQSVLMPIFNVVVKKILTGIKINIFEIVLIYGLSVIFVFIGSYFIKFIFEKIFGKKFTGLLTGGR